jgi:hypothetical protein
MRESLPINGLWEVSARVTLLAPPASSEAQPERVLLSSDPLEILIEGVLEAEVLDYAGHRRSNRLSKVMATASSELGKGFVAGNLCDGKQSTAWLSAPEDGQPSITIVPSSQIKMSRLVLSHHNPNLKNQNLRLPSKLRLILNGASKKPIMVDVDPDPLRKTVVDFGKTRKVKRIEIVIVEAASGELTQGSLGFAEIELLP